MATNIEKRLEALEKGLRQVRDEREIEEMMSRHAVNHVQKNMHRSIQYFALDEPDVSFEIGDRGAYKGAEVLQTLFRDQFGAAVLKGNLLI
ncbi:hypothetical protein AOQ84DRAFT_225835 [Glonium stellatum]|uniref:Uncharacterized protein n=1 Tax=Glonium stellatum TaxID=574774 RepID=A0A8E2ETH8_9PEZI|nr:hypothetical protein AOQ84DRAFT_225835 [Glonium stellatum]